jgi:hypothetical protein
MAHCPFLKAVPVLLDETDRLVEDSIGMIQVRETAR